jgi:hypothetical protein
VTGAPALPSYEPAWRPPPGVGAWMSTRAGGVSAPPWGTLNVGDAVGDDPAAVAENRRRVERAIGARAVWLRQVHGTRVVRVGVGDVGGAAPEADACWTDEPGVACTVQVADCLPVLLAVGDGRAVAAAHAGWRGLAAGVVEAALEALCDGAGCRPSEVSAWLGPCIGPRRFEVGADVLAAFGVAAAAPGGSAEAFVPRLGDDGRPRWLADLQMLARVRLEAAGLRRIDGAAACTYDDASRFFSFRRDRGTGRLVAAVWRLDR